jgi:Zn-finger nucleic acid-binding protein
MKKCPICKVEVGIITYEGFKIMHCPKCRGHLLPLARLAPIRVPQAQLKDEVARDFKKDHKEKINCPKCMMFMKKEKLKIPVLSVFIDVCRTCELVWLDAGELALLQLAHETSRTFANMQDLKRRMDILEASPERKKELEEAIARLPDATNPFEDGIREATDEFITHSVLDILFRKI